MKKLFRKENEGFTIIEVVLVLAIAGLIFLVVFLALPQLQRSRRDTQRRSDTGRILAALETYASNHNGNYPATGTGTLGQFGDNVADDPSFLNTYFGADNFTDPSSGNYESVTTLGTRAGDIVYSNTTDCVGNPGTRYISVDMKLEQDDFCQDNR